MCVTREVALERVTVVSLGMNDAGAEVQPSGRHFSYMNSLTIEQEHAYIGYRGWCLNDLRRMACFSSSRAVEGVVP